MAGTALPFGPFPIEAELGIRGIFAAIFCPLGSAAPTWFAAAGAPSSSLAPPDAPVETWMERYQDGDPRAFDHVYESLSPRLFGYLLRLTRDTARAEDLLQVTFAKVHRARGSYLRGAPVLPWVLAIGRRSFLDEQRRRKSRPEDLSRDGQLPESEPKGDPALDQLAEVLEQALAQIPPAYAEAIQLTKVTGLSVSEAAEVLGTTVSAVKLRVHRGYLKLREHLSLQGLEAHRD